MAALMMSHYRHSGVEEVTYLGMVLDSVAMRAYLTPRRVDDISHLLPIFRPGKRVPYIKFLRNRMTAG
ncbi:hypothetical protein F7725_022413 [Dissostichus mawsoni]|uniref:Uncharacterized protein n=1 Tax=Dissostichus mawsoni TaxID=36200 RepID=A0A7J5Z235_DISMA|nr:hypothetical protein F7725_022413 [Dissostichus mawsoni]